jgi:pyridoxal phosphate enzyme (YggS family)
VKHIGENKIQEAEGKFLWLKDNAPEMRFTRHMIGHLQTNKVRKALQYFDLIHSVDSLKLGMEISRIASDIGKTAEILIEVNTSGEKTKFGLESESVLPLVESLAEAPGVKITGLMTIGAFLPDPEDVRPCFVKLRELRDEIAAQNIAGVEMRRLSMGMTNDFETAIQEGATMVRIGTAIFGARNYTK